MTLPPRTRILTAAGDLLRSGGRGAVSTRAVSTAAEVQPQTIYRQFGDMSGLLDAVARSGFETYLASKARQRRSADPVDDLRAGWDLHVAFGRENPALYVLMFGEPDAVRGHQAAEAAVEVLRGLVEAVARAGRLRVNVEDAAAMIHSASVGVVLSLIADGPFRSADLSYLQRDAVLQAITGEIHEPRGGPVSVQERAIALRSVLSDAAAALTPGELALADELLARVGGIRTATHLGVR